MTWSTVVHGRSSGPMVAGGVAAVLSVAVGTPLGIFQGFLQSEASGFPTPLIAVLSSVSGAIGIFLIVQTRKLLVERLWGPGAGLARAALSWTLAFAIGDILWDVLGAITQGHLGTRYGLSGAARLERGDISAVLEVVPTLIAGIGFARLGAGLTLGRAYGFLQICVASLILLTGTLAIVGKVTSVTQTSAEQLDALLTLFLYLPAVVAGEIILAILFFRGGNGATSVSDVAAEANTVSSLSSFPGSDGASAGLAQNVDPRTAAELSICEAKANAAPTDPVAQAAYAAILQRANRPREAEVQWHKVAILDPNNAAAALNLYRLAPKGSSESAALNHLQAIAAANPHHPDIVSWRAEEAAEASQIARATAERQAAAARAQEAESAAVLRRAEEDAAAIGAKTKGGKSGRQLAWISAILFIFLALSAAAAYAWFANRPSPAASESANSAGGVETPHLVHPELEESDPENGYEAPGPAAARGGPPPAAAPKSEGAVQGPGGAGVVAVRSFWNLQSALGAAGLHCADSLHLLSAQMGLSSPSSIAGQTLLAPPAGMAETQTDMRAGVVVYEGKIATADKCRIGIETRSGRVSRFGHDWTGKPGDLSRLAEVLGAPNQHHELAMGSAVDVWSLADGILVVYKPSTAKPDYEWWLYAAAEWANPSELNIWQAFSWNDYAAEYGVAGDQSRSAEAHAAWGKAVELAPTYYRAWLRWCKYTLTLQPGADLESAKTRCAEAQKSAFPAVRKAAIKAIESAEMPIPEA